MTNDENSKPDLTEQVVDPKISFEELAAKKAKPSRLDSIVTVVLLVICIALALYFIFGHVQGREHAVAPAEGAGASIINVQTTAVQTGRFERYTRLNGEIGSNNSDIGIVPDTSGKITSILVSRGTEVKKGDVIAYLDPSRPGQVYNESPVVSPVDGVITSVPVSVGESVTASTPVATISGEKTLYIESDLPERYIGSIETGMEAVFSSVAYPGRTFHAVISYISPNIDSATRTAHIELRITDDSSILKKGMYVTLDLVTEAEDDVMMVPLSAVYDYEGGKIVYVADEGKARMQSVETGSDNGEMVIILSGLEADDEVITAGAVNDGSSISIIR